MIKIPQIVISITFIFVLLNCRANETRSLWVLPWNITTEEQIDEVVLDAVQNNQNEILAEVRYRSDALYIPNKISTLFNNPEPRSYILPDNGFDPLGYLLTKAHLYGISVQAWLSVLNATPTAKDKLKSNYVMNNHPDWIMAASNGMKMNGNKYLGNFIDPGIPAVKNHLMNVMLDLVVNYPSLDGVQLDYIRYPDVKYGYGSESVKHYKEACKNEQIEWNDWRIRQVTELVADFREQAHLINPHLLITAAVIANILEAKYDYAQDWIDWLNRGIIDRAYPMAYSKTYENFKSTVSNIADLADKDNIVVGLRAWQDNYPSIDYPVKKIIEKADLCRQMEFAGIALFSYDSIKKSSFFPALTEALYKWPETVGMDEDDQFITQLTSSYYYQNLTDTLSNNITRTNGMTVEMYADPFPEHKEENTGSYCDNISFRSDNFYLSFYFEYAGNWNWEITDSQDSLVFRLKKYYPRGYYVEVWNGNTLDIQSIRQGIYTLSIRDKESNIVSQKKFVVIE